VRIFFNLVDIDASDIININSDKQELVKPWEENIGEIKQKPFYIEKDEYKNIVEIELKFNP